MVDCPDGDGMRVLDTTIPGSVISMNDLTNHCLIPQKTEASGPKQKQKNYVLRQDEGLGDDERGVNTTGVNS